MRNNAPVLDAARRLPDVFPVVLYNGTTPWKAPREFADLVQPAGLALETYRPSQRYHVLDEHHVAEGEKLAAEMTLEDMRMTVVERVSEWPKQWMREGFERGIEQGRTEERALLERMAASRFGTDTAQRLSAVLVEIADPERLAEVGEWLVRCETAVEFIARAESVRSAGVGRRS